MKEINGWIARDKDYRLHFFRTKPQKYEDCGEWANGGERYLIPSEFASIKWDDEPQKVKMTIGSDDSEQPEYSDIITTHEYIVGKKPTWKVGDTLASYYSDTDSEGEIVYGKIVDISFDEKVGDWKYVFDHVPKWFDGNEIYEETLFNDEAYCI